MSKHTAGPWRVSGYHRAVLEKEVSRDGCSVTIAEMPPVAGPGFECGYNKANARLIAAAPELLKIVEQLDRLSDNAELIPYPLKVGFRLVCHDADKIIETLKGETK